MAFSSSFHERLQRMESTRNQRISLLQAEKELQSSKNQLLASKLSVLRSREQRCLMMDQKIASQNFKIAALRSEMISLEVKHQSYTHQLRGLKSELEELEELEKERDRYYDSKCLEMESFRGRVKNFTTESQSKVQDLSNRVKELKSNLQSNKGDLNNPAIAAAERKRSELLEAKENLDKTLASNYQVRAQLQKQLQSILVAQMQEHKR